MVPVEHTAPLSPAPGDPLLLVLPLSLGTPIHVERINGPADKKGIVQPFGRLVINSKGIEGRFKVFLIPFRMGEDLPLVSYYPAESRCTVEWKDQKDTIFFNVNEKGKTGLLVKRDGKPILATP